MLCCRPEFGHAVSDEIISAKKEANFDPKVQGSNINVIFLNGLELRRLSHPQCARGWVMCKSTRASSHNLYRHPVPTIR